MTTNDPPDLYTHMALVIRRDMANAPKIPTSRKITKSSLLAVGYGKNLPKADKP